MKKIIEDILHKNLKIIDEKIVVTKMPPLEFLLEKKEKSIFRSKMKFSLVFSVVLLLCISLAVYGYNKFLYNNNNLTIDKGLENAEKKGSINYSLSSSASSGITLSIKGVVSDTLRTVIYIQLSGNNLSIENSGLCIESISDKEGHNYKLNSVVGGQEIGSPKGISDKRIEIEGGPKTDTEFILKVVGVGKLKGNWVLSFPVKVFKPKEFIVNKEFTYKDTKILVEKILFSDSTTEIRLKEYGEFLDIKGGKISSPLVQSNFLNGNLEPDGKQENVLNCSLHFEPMDYTGVNNITYSMLLDLNNRNTWDIDIPIKN